MALFQKNPYDNRDQKPLYTLGLNRTVLIVGLGNTGKQYADTRHNIGFVVIDDIAKALEADQWVDKKDLHCQLAIGHSGDSRVILCKPTTMMNLSGKAVQAVQHFYKLSNRDTVVVHDELDINFGQIRCRIGGSDAGHNGVASIIEQVSENFGRVRIGIGPKTPDEMDSADFVLAKFSEAEKKQLSNLNKETVALLTERIASGQLPHDTRTFLV